MIWSISKDGWPTPTGTVRGAAIAQIGSSIAMAGVMFGLILHFQYAFGWSPVRAGTHDPDEMIRSVKRGLYAVNFGGGQVDITSGKYVFSATEAYLIEDGKVTAPVKGATLIGNGPETMQRVSMIGNDLALDEGVGVCGKDGQSVPVGVGQPSLLIDQITVGGTQA